MVAQVVESQHGAGAWRRPPTGLHALGERRERVMWSVPVTLRLMGSALNKTIHY
jgi:hypothetical protein